MKKIRKKLALVLALCMVWSCTAVSATGDAELTPAVETTQTPAPAEPTVEPTAAPVAETTVEPTAEPTAVPAAEADETAADVPALAPTADAATEIPTAEPTTEPATEPDASPTAAPTTESTVEPVTEPTAEPTAEPTSALTAEPTAESTPTPEPTMPVVEDVLLPSEAAQQVQAMLNALPTADELAAMDADARAAAYAQVSAAYEAYEMLTETEKTQITGADRFASLFEILNSAVDTLEEETATPSYTVTIPTSISLNKDNSMTITVSGCVNLEGKQIQVRMSSSNGYQLKCGEQAIDYTVQRNGQTVNNGSTFSFSGDGSETFGMTVGDVSGKPAGEYQDTLTFSISVSAGE